jgi:outer membrane protein assembly factor BamB
MMIWNVTHGMQNFWPPTVDDDGRRVYLTGYVGSDTSNGGTSVSAFDAMDGHLLWRSSAIKGDTLRVTVAGNLLFAASGCTLSALDVKTGEMVSQATVDGCAYFYAYYGPLIVGPYLIISDDVSYLIVLRGAL